MSDTMEVWQLCPHGQTEPHWGGWKGDYAGGCDGGKRIVLRQVSVDDVYREYMAGDLHRKSSMWVINGSDDE